MIVAVIAVCWLTTLIGVVIGNNSVFFPYTFVDPALAFIPRILLIAIPTAKSRLGRSWLTPVEFLLMLLILANAPGSLYLHSLPIQYDRFLHYIAGFLLLMLAMPILGPFYARNRPREKRRLIVISLLLLFVGLFLWELFQWSADQLLGTKLFGDVAQPIQVDVAEDIIFGTVGLLSAIPFLYLDNLWRWLTQGQE